MSLDHHCPLIHTHKMANTNVKCVFLIMPLHEDNFCYWSSTMIVSRASNPNNAILRHTDEGWNFMSSFVLHPYTQNLLIRYIEDIHTQTNLS